MLSVIGVLWRCLDWWGWWILLGVGLVNCLGVCSSVWRLFGCWLIGCVCC